MIWQLLYSIVHTLRISNGYYQNYCMYLGHSNGSITLLDLYTCTVHCIIYVWQFDLGSYGW